MTVRKHEIFNLVAEGNTSAEIAEILVISRHTVEVHRANIMHKLGLRTPIEVVRYALKWGMLPPDGEA